MITATIRALKMHGGGPRVAPGNPLPREYTHEDLGLLEKGIPNLLHHIRIVKMSGMKPVVCINRFTTDTRDEIALVRRFAEGEGARVAVSEQWLKGGEGALGTRRRSDRCMQAKKSNSVISIPSKCP